MPITESQAAIKRDADEYLEMWRGLWSVRDTAWHLEHRHPILVKYTDLLFADEENNVVKNRQRRMLFPLCGKNLDMKWFWEQGHQVVGVECAQQAIDDFAKFNNIKFNTDKLPDVSDAKVFETDDKNLKIIQTNFLTLDSSTLNGTIDLVWDRGAFGTITREEQVLYAQTMNRLLANDFQYLLLVLEFDEQAFKGPPFSTSEQRIRQMFGEFCNIEKLECSQPQHVGLYQRHMGQPLQVEEAVYLLTRNN